jgi:hypothetical protein
MDWVAFMLIQRPLRFKKIEFVWDTSRESDIAYEDYRWANIKFNILIVYYKADLN